MVDSSRLRHSFCRDLSSSLKLGLKCQVHGGEGWDRRGKALGSEAEVGMDE